VGLCSYLLISFWYTRISANKAALKAMIVNRVGDCSFSLGIFCIYYIFRTFDFHTVFTLSPYFLNTKIFFFLFFSGHTYFNLYSFVHWICCKVSAGWFTYVITRRNGRRALSELKCLLKSTA